MCCGAQRSAIDFGQSEVEGVVGGDDDVGVPAIYAAADAETVDGA